jgi:hypothetical protein
MNRATTKFGGIGQITKVGEVVFFGCKAGLTG